MTSLRPNQQAILAYTGGKLGISAVPGSGKTFTLSLLAAQLVLAGGLEDDQEVLIVTLTNSAVENFYRRLSGLLEEHHLFPNFGYRVRTLHGLANDIVRESSARLNLPAQFAIVDDREATAIRDEISRAWLASHPDFLDPYYNRDLTPDQAGRITDQYRLALVQEIALAFIRSAKNLRQSPEALRGALQGRTDLPLAVMGCDLYTAYQRSLDYRVALDFDDLIGHALQALESDRAYLDHLRYRWPYILEDEAQDSSLLQEQILKLLAGDQPPAEGGLPPEEVNWVRVGDPNQAIFETFTTANPRFLREFIRRPDVDAKDLPDSGRFSRSIVALANGLAEWTYFQHPVAGVRDALQPDPLIRPIAPGDPQPLQPDDPYQVRLVEQKYTSDQELDLVADELKAWLPAHPQDTVAVLTHSNDHASKMVDALSRRNLPFNDSLLRASSTARTTVRGLETILTYLCDAKSSHKLVDVYQVWRRGEPNTQENFQINRLVTEWLRRQNRLEAFLWSEPGQDPLDQFPKSPLAPQALARLCEFRELVRRWVGAVLYPIDQVILTVAQDLLTDPLEWAITQKLAASLRRSSRQNPASRLPELLREISGLERTGYKGFGTDENGFDPSRHPGEVVVATLHKAKGLEWDRVYILSANAYDFPSALPGDSFRSERWFVRDNLNLQVEATEQLAWALRTDLYAGYQEGQASRQARLDCARERLRLLYVGLTRARRELIVTWNTGRNGKNLPALPLTALAAFWKDRLAALESENTARLS